MFKILQNNQYFLITLNSFFLFICLVLTLSFWFSLPSFASSEGDAVGIQIYKNVNNYSAARWYKNEFSEEGGTPRIVPDVDGYEAVQDGRTVYVNAGNVNDSDYFSNIYMLSFWQEPDNNDTRKVHTNMLKHWTFNTNLIEEEDDYGTCSIPSLVCLSATDCFAGYICRVDDESGEYPEEITDNILADLPAGYMDNMYYDNKCHLPIEKEIKATCWRDRDCKSDKTGIYCSGDKAKITRRTKRLANLADIKTRFDDFLIEDEENALPSFVDGSYIPRVTLSTWDSWNRTSDSLSTLVPSGDLPEDPINTMGSCPGNFDPDTCWDDVMRFDGVSQFAGNIDNASGIAINSDGGSISTDGSSFYGYSSIVEVVYSFSPDGTIVCPLNGDDCCRKGDPGCDY